MRREKKSNPYSSRGLDEFARLHTELAAKRGIVAKKKGVPVDAVKFVYRNERWVPLVVRNNYYSNNGSKALGGSTVAPVDTLATVETVAPVETMEPVETKANEEKKFERNEDLEIEGIHGAIGVIIVVLYMIYGGTLCAILWVCACFWWCVLVMLRKGKHGYFHDNMSRIRMTIDVVSKRDMG